MGEFLQQRLDQLREAGTFRELSGTVQGIDFWSNDYLGLSRLTNPTTNSQPPITNHSATGSRSISGDFDEFHALEKHIATYHGQEAALIFNSGYTANLGLLSALLRRTDTIFYDELMHASCRDGIRLGQARAFRFAHNDLEDLQQQLHKARPDGNIFVLTEGRFSMDGDLGPVAKLAELCEAHGAHLIVDEAHSGGIEGKNGAGLVAGLGLQQRVFATVMTYGKAFGSHGAAVLGSHALREYLINTSRPFIYSTAPAPAQWADISAAYAKLAAAHQPQHTKLQAIISLFRTKMEISSLAHLLLPATGPIQILQIPGNKAVMQVETACKTAGLLVKGIRSPTVAVGSERIRLCLHAFNTESELEHLVNCLRSQLLTPEES
ncbi:MAG: aminotransferase class I/II-fold pyridoxal phosphate-dependent enzyme [Bacteroidota bacterium]